MGDWAHCYSNSDKIKPVSFERTANDDGYIINFPEFKNSEAHLCYEVQSLINNEWKVMGITYTKSFTDTYNYGSSKPKYKFFGYDRNLDHSGDSGEIVPEIKPIEPVVRVCRIGETYYDTLSAAIGAANAEDTILLCKSFTPENVGINKQITIMPDEGLKQPIIITKKNAGNLISTGTNGIKFGSNDRVSIILDGGNFEQTGTLFRSGNQGITIENVQFRNNVNREEEGAIFLGQNGKVTLENCIIEYCRASSGGAINTRGGAVGSTIITLEDVIIRNSIASNNGGGIHNSGTNGHSSIVITKGLIVENNTVNNGGGIYVVMSADLTNSIIRKNTARNQGADIYVDCDINNNDRKLRTNNVQVLQNNIANGIESAVYISNGRFIINGGTFSGRIQKTNSGELQLNNWSDLLLPTIPDFSAAMFVLDLENENGNVLFSNIGDGFQI